MANQISYCAICLDGLHNSTDEVVANECGHCYHGGCIRRAMRLKQACPTCRDKCNEHTLIKLYFCLQDQATDTQAAEDSKPIEIDCDEDDGPAVRAAMQETRTRLRHVQNALDTALQATEAEKNKGEALEEQVASLKEEAMVLSQELVKHNRNKWMHDLERTTFRVKTSEYDDKLLKGKQREAELMAENQKLLTAAAISAIITDRTLDEQEILNLHRKADPKTVIIAQAKSLAMVNKMTFELNTKITQVARERDGQERQSKKFEIRIKKMQDERVSLQTRVAHLEKELAGSQQQQQQQQQ
eukprot:CAMPEP_0198205172 /NCGR_PEP_ID=MMETSP1445-20131203/8655_1 /TAXON_ID=36898 /ORGANISM="Pyramimonas sp., Strain CCMP2087" /LENGTH=299 /DNA_ID=CAMNT_0043877345 /DNA_START=632 /DNA_END=1528 /DNA_ORIENTATION=-